MQTPEPKPHSQRLRAGRSSIPQQVYLVTTVTASRIPHFSDYQAGRLVVNALKKTERSARTLAFVVMPDHLHWLLQLREGYTLSQVVGFVQSSTSRALNLAYLHSGRVWIDGFHDLAIRREERLRDCARYIIANPVRAGLVERPGDYPLWDAAWLP